MKPKSMTFAALTLLLAAAALPAGIVVQSTTASAQTSAAPAPKPAAASTQNQMMARVEKRISDLHAQLKITPAEEPQWKQFADVMRDNAQTMGENAGARAQKFQSMNAAENMKSYADMAVAHGQNMQKLAAAFETLYSAMSPEQQKTADAVFRSRAARTHRKKAG